MQQRNRLAIALSWAQARVGYATTNDLDDWTKVGPRSISS
jgi:hypothetical protein